MELRGVPWKAVDLGLEMTVKKGRGLILLWVIPEEQCFISTQGKTNKLLNETKLTAYSICLCLYWAPEALVLGKKKLQKSVKASEIQNF